MVLNFFECVEKMKEKLNEYNYLLRNDMTPEDFEKINSFIQELNHNIQEADKIKRILTKRELEILEMVSKGLSNTEIANILFVSINTVKAHVSKLLEKMNVDNRILATKLVAKIGLFE